MKPPFQVTNEILNLVSSISEELGKISSHHLVSPSPQLRKQNRIRTIQGTLAIEGNTLSLDQITAVLEGKRIIGDQKEIIEVENAIKLYDKLSSFKAYSVKDFLKAHKLLMSHLIPSAGKFRDRNVGVLKGTKVSHVAPKPKLVPELIEKLFSWAKTEKDLHPLVKSCIIHYEIEFIHPFEDGNGRMGRFWQSVLLSKSNPLFAYIPIESLIRENQKAYYQALEKCDRIGDSTAFIEFILKLLLKSLLDFSKEVTELIMDTEDRLEKGQIHFQDRFFSRKDYMVFFKNISSATASRDLREGVESNKLIKSGTGNQTKYRFK